MASMEDFVSTHKGLVIGGGLVAILVFGGKFLASRSTPASTTGGDLSGLQNGNLVYVPTQTSFTTENQSGIFASNDPTLTSISNTGPVNSPTTTTTTTQTGRPIILKPPTSQPPTSQPPVTRQPPPPQPKPQPRPTNKSIKWNVGYTVAGGDTLSGIASKQTQIMRHNGMPGSMSISWHDIYAHNTAKIIATSNAHGNPIPGGAWNNIFPGEQLTIPSWS